MAISLSNYINIFSEVGGASSVATRSLIGRMFTGNTLLSPGTFLQFSSASDVGLFFGYTSEEYYRALFYFAWVSKNLLSPPALQFARWVNVATAPIIHSIPNQVQFANSAWTAIGSGGSLTLTMGASTQTFSIDFTAVTDPSDIAAAIQAAINGGTGLQFTSATVAVNGTGYTLTGGDPSAVANISVTSSNITGQGFLGWLPNINYSNNIFSANIYNTSSQWISGSPIQTLTNMLNASQAYSNNFGSFLFLNNLNLTLTQAEEIAAWNAASAQNNMYLYTVPVVGANVSSWQAGLKSYEGTALTLNQTSIVQTGTLVSTSPTINGLNNVIETLQVGMGITGTDIPLGTVIKAIVNDNTVTMSANASGSVTEAITFYTVQFPEQCPMMIEAATNYYGTNTVQNYMFQVFDPYLTPLVTDTSTAQGYDAISVNYYGQTQTAGNFYNFYQRGLLQGGSTAPADQNTYINEIWLKDALATSLMNLLLGLTELPANTQGQALALVTIQGVINQALLNGTISIGKALTPNQIAFITATTSDSTAYFQVQNSGYWVNCIIQPIPDVLPTQYEAAYTLIYSKNDVVRYISGTDILI